MGEVDVLKQQIHMMAERMRSLEEAFQKSQRLLVREVVDAIDSKQKKDVLKQEVLRKYTRNKKSVIKQKILDVLKKEKMSLADLKYYIVDQVHYCSKASFYRYIEELKPFIEIKDNTVFLAEDVLV